MLFSEPKIPQFAPDTAALRAVVRVSVLFSEPKIPQCVWYAVGTTVIYLQFQCSSASRKFLNLFDPQATGFLVARFSALQRAENSSIAVTLSINIGSSVFQCSSASRKFLNRDAAGNRRRAAAVSVLFSEPKIPQ